MENGGPGTVFLYHLVHTHRTLLIDNDGGKPLNKHINYAKLDEEGMYVTSALFTFSLKSAQVRILIKSPNFVFSDTVKRTAPMIVLLKIFHGKSNT